MDKVIFMDCDGVINNTKTFKNGNEIDKTLVKRILNIIEKTGVKIVVSSTWRLSEKTCEALKKSGIDFIDTTPDLRDKDRGYEIEAWLKEHQVKKYAILDDDSDMLPEQKPYFFKTSFKTGLTEKIEKNIIRYFNEDLRLCLYCGKLMERIPDPVTHKKSIYMWRCSCMPKNSFVSIR